MAPCLRPRATRSTSKKAAEGGLKIKHGTEEARISPSAKFSTRTVHRGIVCDWIAKMSLGTKKSTWEITFRGDFDWKILKSEGVETITGRVVFKPSPEHPGQFPPQEKSVYWTRGSAIVLAVARTNHSEVNAVFEYQLTAEYKEAPVSKRLITEPAGDSEPQVVEDWEPPNAEILALPLAENVYDALPEIEPRPYDKMFEPSELNDTIVVVEGRRLYVNKSFLCYHSNYFRSLFASQPAVEAGRQPEFPIDGVSYEDFGLLLSTIYPDNVFPNDDTAEKLLQLNCTFQMQSVTIHVEDHLLRSDYFSNARLMWLADAYGLVNLFQRTILSMDSEAKIKDLQNLPEYHSLTSDAKSMICDRIMEII